MLHKSHHYWHYWPFYLQNFAKNELIWPHLYGTYVNCQSLLANSMLLMFSRWNFLLSYKSTRCKLGPLLFKHLVRDRGRSLHETETVSERESMKLRRPLATVLVCHTGKSCGPIRTEYRINQPLICKNWFLIVIIDLIVPRPASRLLYWLKWTFIPHSCVLTHIVLWLLLNVTTAVATDLFFVDVFCYALQTPQCDWSHTFIF